MDYNQKKVKRYYELASNEVFQKGDIFVIITEECTSCDGDRSSWFSWQNKKMYLRELKGE